MDGVYSQVAGLAVGLRPPPLADCHLHWSRLGVAHKTFAVMPPPSQVINMRNRNRSQPLIFLMFILPIFPAQNSLRRWTGHFLMGFVDSGQQLQIATSEPAGKSMALIDGLLHLAVLHVLTHQPGHLGPASSRHLGHVPQQQSPHRLTLCPEALRLSIRVIHWYISTRFLFELDLLACLQQPLNLLTTQFLGVLRADDHSPASATTRPSGPSCIG